MNWEPGDIMLLKRPKRGWWETTKLMFSQIWTFFFKKQGLIEIVSKYYHIQMAFDSTQTITQEPPACHIEPYDPNLKLRVWRLKNKPVDFVVKFNIYAKAELGREFDFKKFWALVLDETFKTKWFGTHAQNQDKNVCAEFVSRFYVMLGFPVGNPESILPSDVNRFCEESGLFELVRDDI